MKLRIPVITYIWSNSFRNDYVNSLTALSYYVFFPSLSYDRIMCTNELIKCVCVLVFDILLTNLYETNN